MTTGKFNVEARDVGEEKHFTLLSGDIFLEKLNALPPAARGELFEALLDEIDKVRATTKSHEVHAAFNRLAERVALLSSRWKPREPRP